MKLYSLVDQTKYMITVTSIHNIEDAPDDCITHEELCELAGIPNLGWVGTTVVLMDAMKEAIVSAKETMIKEQKRSCVIDDDLVTALTTSYYQLTYFCDGVVRKGNKLCLKPEKKTVSKPPKHFVNSLACAVSYTIERKFNFQVNFKSVMNDVPNSVRMFHKLIEWDQIDLSGMREENKVFVKQIWDNPDLFEKVTS